MLKFIARTALGLGLSFLFAMASNPAFASFGDCNSSAYLSQFDSRFGSTPGFLCVESDRVPVNSEAGTTNIRIVQHLVADWAMRPGAMRSIKDGVAASVRAMERLGSFRISDVTILLVDGFDPAVTSERLSDTAALTNGGLPGGECLITLWLLTPDATASYVGSVVAHELFHCVERASMTLAQTRSGAEAGGLWWTEGAAVWFSTAAWPAMDFQHQCVANFDHDSPTVPLNDMSYNAYPFFAWLGAVPNKIMPFLHQMASSSSPSAQRAAMIAALPAEQWLKFAENYMDQQIHDGQGASIGSSPQRGPTYDWTETRTQRVGLPPFVLKRSTLTFHCGRWNMRPQPPKFHAAKPEGGEWGPIPETIDAMGGDQKTFNFVGIAAADSAVDLQIAGTLASRCQECAGTREIDRCLVGTWQVSLDGMQQWMREHIHQAHVTGASQVGNTLTLNSDGTFATGASHVTAHLEGADNMQGHGALNSNATGRWSSSSGQLSICPDTSSMAGTITVIKHGHPITIPYPARAMPNSSRAYTCSGNSFTLTTPIGGAGSVVSTYSKTAPAL